MYQSKDIPPQFLRHWLQNHKCVAAIAATHLSFDGIYVRYGCWLAIISATTRMEMQPRRLAVRI